jgi:hypothetical protein
MIRYQLNGILHSFAQLKLLNASLRREWSLKCWHEFLNYPEKVRPSEISKSAHELLFPQTVELFSQKSVANFFQDTLFFW